MEKRNRNVMILSIVALVLVLVGVTYAYFSAQITGIESASTISLTAGRMGIVYSEGDENVTVSNIYPREEAWVTKVFTLTGYNTTNEEMKYDIGLNVETNGFASGYLTYDLKVLENTKGVPVSEKSNIPINGISKTSNGTGKIKFGTGSFTNADGDKHTYELKIYFKDNGLDQNDAQGAVFNAKLYVSEYEPKRINIALNSTNSEEVQVISSYDINYDKCISTAPEQFTQEMKDDFCHGKAVYPDAGSISLDIARGHAEELISDGIIENVVYDGENITSYSINKEKCLSLLSGSETELTSEQKETYCSGGTITNGLPFSIPIIVNNETGRSNLISEGVIENVEYTTEVRPVVGTGYPDGQYTYRYKQGGCVGSTCLVSNVITSKTKVKLLAGKAGTNKWQNIEEDGWGVILTDPDSTDPVTTELALSINNKPIVSMARMFYYSKATTIDLSSFNTSNVTDMSYMFAGSQAITLDLRTFDITNVTNMNRMFQNSQVTTLDLSNFDLTGKNIKYILDSFNIKTVKVKDENNMNLICNSGDNDGNLQFEINGVIVPKPDNCKYIQRPM